MFMAQTATNVKNYHDCIQKGFRKHFLFNKNWRIKRKCGKFSKVTKANSQIWVLAISAERLKQYEKLFLIISLFLFWIFEFCLLEKFEFN